MTWPLLLLLLLPPVPCQHLSTRVGIASILTPWAFLLNIVLLQTTRESQGDRKVQREKYSKTILTFSFFWWYGYHDRADLKIGIAKLVCAIEPSSFWWCYCTTGLAQKLKVTKGRTVAGIEPFIEVGNKFWRNNSAELEGPSLRLL